MSSLSLANKYRPSDFDTTLIGQDHISRILKHQISQATRQANYLFFWMRGTGKTSSARLFAKAINCLNLHDGNPCGECENCKLIQNNETMDIMEIDAASHTGVDNIRDEIIDKVGYRPTVLKKKVIIIDEVHMLSKGAFNALLKTMEEPKEWMVFILATTEFNKVPETIASRCQIFNFRKVPLPRIVQHLQMIADKENISADESWLSMIAKLSDGSVRDAVKYLDQISVMGEVNSTTVWQFLGVVSDQIISDLLEQLKQYQTSNSSDDFHALISHIEELSTNGIDLWNLPQQLMYYANEHFQSDPQFYSSISKLSSTLLSQSKRYPHPLLLYKTVFWQQEVTEGNKKQQEVTNSNKKEKVIENKDDSSHNKESHHKKADWITTDFVSKLTPSLQNILDDKCEFEDLKKEVVTLFVINPGMMGEKGLQKKENQELMLSTLHNLWYPHVKALEFKSITPEEYVMKKMSSSQ